MRLREHIWRHSLRVDTRANLPKMYNKYAKSSVWAAQLYVLDQDLLRMPSMHRGNVIKLVKRHAATVPWHPYTQGHLYLIYTIALVLKDERSLYWGYRRICRLLHPFGPDTAYATHVVPDWIYNLLPFNVDRKLFDVVIRFRWMYIMFGQTFTTSSSICAIWDYILPNFTNIYRVCASLLVHSIAISDATGCALERLTNIVSVQIKSDTVVAQIIAYSQAIVL